MSPQFESARIPGGGIVEFDVAKRMEGGMKHVYFTRDRSSVVAFFHDRQAEQQRTDRLMRVVNQYNPTRDGQANSAYWRESFCWPTSLVEHPTFGVGVQLPAYPDCFFFKAGELKGKEKDGGWFNCIDRKSGRPMRYTKVHESERGFLGTYLAAMTRVARSVERMHNAGLAHADLSERNVLIDPSSGRAVIIDLDSLVVKGLYPPDVLGTPGYIAPEVLATRRLATSMRRLPDADTDKYALAVMIYKYLLERHPLEGSRVLAGLSAEQEDEAVYGAKGLYSEHRTDAANRPKARAYLSASILGRRIDDLFHKTFVEGLLGAVSRPTPGAWVTALCEAFDLLVACSNSACSHKQFVLGDRKKPVCPYCKTNFRGVLGVIHLSHSERGFTRSEGEVVLNGYLGGSGTILYKFHTHRGAIRGPGQDATPLAQVLFLETPTRGLYMQNLGLVGLMARNARNGSDSFQSIPLNSKLQLSDGLEMRFGSEPEARSCIVEMISA